MGEKLKNGLKVVATKIKDIASKELNISVGELVFCACMTGCVSTIMTVLAQRASYSQGVSDGITWMLQMMGKEQSK